jgi:RNA polymerase sigma factor (sigma-70 family)
MPTDAELLHRYAGQNDGRAFAELVQRHLGLVYATAQRGTGGRAHLAEEIAQKVFTDLARKSTSLCHHPALTAWLYRSARHAAQAVARAELRRQKLNETFATMPDNAAPPDSSLDWERLRPVLDEVMEELKERDRELMLLRFFEGLSFVEVGARLNLSENAARMRTERALDKLRLQLGRRGVTSTSAALGILMANQVFAAAPAGLAATVTTTTLAAVPATSGILSFLLMSKITIPALSIALAAGLTMLTWSAVASDVSPEELAALRAENARLTQATAAGAPAASVAAVADAYAAQANTIVQAVGKRLGEKNAAGTGKFRNHGQATPQDAARSWAWAADSGDVAALTKLFAYDQKGLETIQAIHATMPESIRAQYRSPEELIAFLYIAQTLLNPVPGEEVWEKKITDAAINQISPGRVEFHPPGQKSEGPIFVQTPDGWKLELPTRLLAPLVAHVLSNEMLNKLIAH